MKPLNTHLFAAASSGRERVYPAFLRLILSLVVLLTGGLTTAEAASFKESLRLDRPRIWMKGAADWDYRQDGTFAWRIMHGQAREWPWFQSPENDQEKDEFGYCAGADNDDDYGADNMYGRFDHDFGIRAIEPVIAAKAQQLNWKSAYQGTWTLNHTADEYFADARAKLLYIVQLDTIFEFPNVAAMQGAAAYDWLLSESYANGTPVLSAQDRAQIASRLVIYGDFLRRRADGNASPFDASRLADYYYVMIGIALYDPARASEPAYAAIHSKAVSFLDSFDKEFIGKVLPFWQKQGDDGGWHGGLTRATLPFWTGGGYEQKNNVAPLSFAHILFACYTASNLTIENSLMNIGMLKWMPHFQLFMMQPTALDQDRGAPFFDIGGEADVYSRSPWILPMRAYSRRRFSADLEQRRLAELGAWIRVHFGKMFTDYGSWDTIDQLLFEDKWVLPRAPEDLGVSHIRHFKNLGWVFMRTGFQSANDMASLFISQPFHWSTLDPYAQNLLLLNYKGPLLKGYISPIHIDGESQRTHKSFPLIKEGADRYAVNSDYDVGPGITDIQIENDYTSITADASHAYRRDKISAYIRKLVYLTPDRFIVMDRVYTLSPQSSKAWRIKPAGTVQNIDDRTMYFRNGSGGALWLKRLLPETGTVTASTSQLYEFTAPNNAHETIFLYVLQTADDNITSSSPSLTADDAAVVQESGSLLVRLPDWEVRFSLDPIGKTSVQRKNSAATDDNNKPSPSQSAPRQLQLNQNYPNPFNGEATISYELQKKSPIRVLIYSTQGTQIRSLVNSVQTAGHHEILWDGNNDQGQKCSSGIYVCHIECDGEAVSNKMAFVR